MLKIRTARAEDTAPFNEMGNTNCRHHFAHLWYNASELACYPQQEYSLASLQRNLTDSQYCWLIAEAPHPVGFAKYACRQAISPEGPSGTLLYKLYLLPDAMDRRYGGQIFRTVEARAKAAGERRLWPEVLVDNPAARRSYERQRMQYVRDAVFHPASQQSTLHILAKPIREVLCIPSGKR